MAGMTRKSDEPCVQKKNGGKREVITKIVLIGLHIPVCMMYRTISILRIVIIGNIKECSRKEIKRGRVRKMSLS